MKRRNFLATLAAAPLATLLKPSLPRDQKSDEHDLGDFIGEGGNENAVRTVREFVNQTPRKSTLLTIVSTTGNGGTHLALAAKSLLHQLEPFRATHIISAESFVNEFELAKRSDRVDQFRDKFKAAYKNLIVDQIAFLIRHEEAQFELRRLLSVYRYTGRRVILTSNPHPEVTQLSLSLIRWTQRFPLVRVVKPSSRARLRIAKTYADLYDVPLSKDILTFIVEQNHGSVREMLATVWKTQGYSRLKSLQPSIAIARKFV